MAMSHRENLMICFQSWEEFDKNLTVGVKIWTLAGTPESLYDKLIHFFSYTVDRNQLKDYAEEFTNAEPSDMVRIYWLQNTRLNQQITSLNGRIILSYMRVVRLFNHLGKLQPEQELNIFIGSNFPNVIENKSFQDQAFEEAWKRLYDN